MAFIIPFDPLLVPAKYCMTPSPSPIEFFIFLRVDCTSSRFLLGLISDSMNRLRPFLLPFTFKANLRVLSPEIAFDEGDGSESESFLRRVLAPSIATHSPPPCTASLAFTIGRFFLMAFEAGFARGPTFFAEDLDREDYDDGIISEWKRIGLVHVEVKKYTLNKHTLSVGITSA